MGNASGKGMSRKVHSSVTVVRDDGEVLQFKGPISVREIRRRFPGHVILSDDHTAAPLHHSSSLINGGIYHLVPCLSDGKTTELGDVKDKDTRSAVSPLAGKLDVGSSLRVLPSPRKGVWSVKFVMGSEQLEEIMSEDVSVEALIETMRIAAAENSGYTGNRKRRWTHLLGFVRGCLYIPKPHDGL